MVPAPLSAQVMVYCGMPDTWHSSAGTRSGNQIMKTHAARQTPGMLVTSPDAASQTFGVLFMMPQAACQTLHCSHTTWCGMLDHAMPPPPQHTHTHTHTRSHTHAHTRSHTHSHTLCFFIIAFPHATTSVSSAAKSQSLQRAPFTRPGPGSTAHPGYRVAHQEGLHNISHSCHRERKTVSSSNL
eukprot:351330-Chlamydomonas_euryale.AAC.1